MIKPEFWSSKTLNRVSLESRLTFIGMWNFADDYGVLLDSNRRILGDIFPIDEGMTEKKIGASKDELIDVGLLVPVEHEGQNFLIIRGWDEHQNVPNKSKRFHIEPEEIPNYLESNESLIREKLERNESENRSDLSKEKEKDLVTRDAKASYFENFWKQTKFPKRKQDVKGEMKKKYLACLKAGISPDDILFSSDIFAQVHAGDQYSIGMRKFLTPDTVKEYLEEDVRNKGKQGIPLMAGNNEAVFREVLQELEQEREQSQPDPHGILEGGF